MWAIKNRTPYRVGKTWARDKNGVHEWIVAVKGTFDIKPNGNLELADEQLEPLILPEYIGEVGESSLRYDADLVTLKPTTDLVLNGTAHAPNGCPSPDFPVAVRVGTLSKTLRVKGNRRWGEGLFGSSSSAVEPITQMPIIYERAYGGYDQTDPDPKNHRIDLRNPVGCGVVAQPRHRLGQPLPNFEYLGGNLENAGPAGFGAIDSFWSPRRELHGTYDHAWRKGRYPLLPLDWNPRSVLSSPADQRPEAYLVGGEQVELKNLTPSGVLRFSLPKVRFIFRTIFSTRFGARVEEYGGRLATVILEPDYPRVIMVWSSTLHCAKDPDYLEETIVYEDLQR
jgi:hypothetical protein